MSADKPDPIQAICDAASKHGGHALVDIRLGPDPLLDAHRVAERVAREAGVTVEHWHVSVGYERAPTRWERFKAWVARVWS